MKDRANHPLCPSAVPAQEDSVIIGVVGGTVEEPRVAYLVEPQPVTGEILALAAPAAPTEILRFAASCAEDACKHFDGSSCRLATRVVRVLPTVVDRLPACHIRSRCRWWRQEGKAACMRCPQIVTDSHTDSPELAQVAFPE